MIRRSVHRTKDGRYEVSLTPPERELLGGLGPRMREVFADPMDPVLKRLFPVAYPDDTDRQTEYRLLVHEELQQSLLASVEVLEQSADAEELSEDELLAWIRAINQVRLTLGTRLEVTEEGDERPADDEDPKATSFAIYDYLTDLQGEIIHALDGGLPAGGLD